MSEAVTKLCVLISGNGSNLQAIIDEIKAHRLNAQISGVISNRPNAYGLERAKEAGIEAVCIDHTQYEDRIDYDNALKAQIDAFGADCVVLAGFMRILTPEFVNYFSGKLVNIHPSLLPKYKGLNTHQRAIDNSDTEHGVSVHFVTPELDGGPVIIQSRVPVFEDDTASDLAERVQEQERRIYPLVLSWYSAGRLKMRNNKAVLDDQELPESGYASE
ncbi:phosphoribosylglycinamide formyltransferase [Alteromonas sp. McT4-15]|uniref:phosphoribosylglycinamide formyltransferase n=1 Tax=unclassified Alteromonas TaxID=2614992 RepID=UPI0012E5D9BF|nr:MULTISPECIES: phosphoribosylglycinamide formyltransferase [unclassified Alteromonas]MEC8231991.1 phosphoribosylglycinamide formyltransferase [Pseudomonadota bacterium]GFD88884.1 phosphoribosylglycinamide formyltransferase [Tenacibaculum sp. KUL152]MCB4437170.1 phosphoribosylglycinamide formyltransferase [Alteromonas sp. McT4-15]WDT87909.1 phosphoribosylglycinamide formyltransferase [Alteromonas sp. 009811495]BCO19009.1 phosphoribosylglycinamide formyltransferase [Alteromonas sp. KC3]